MLTVLDLFSGIGGFSLGLERTGGFKTVAFCEIDPFCRKVLAKHWPGVPCFEDITAIEAVQISSLGTIDVICGGFPCQDISTAGKRAGITGERSGLWRNMVGTVRMVRPRYVVVENVAALLSNGLDTVLGDLASIGYDCEWHCIPASAVGAPHRRDRWWGVAYADGLGHGRRRQEAGRKARAQFAGSGGDRPEDVAHPVSDARQQRRLGDASEGARGRDTHRGGIGSHVADAGREGLSAPERKTIFSARWWDEGRAATERGWWRVEPDVGRVAHGVPSRVDRLRSLGNAVVPQIPELIGYAILEAEKQRCHVTGESP